MHLEKLRKFHGREGPVLLVVADGVGLAPAGPANSLSLANTPIIDQLLQSKHSVSLHAHGTHVGLPTDADMGNSEVGHNTLGGGRVFDQGAKLVNAAFESGSLYESAPWSEIENRGQDGNTIHFIGLLSDGNVHSHIDHLLALIHRCKDSNIQSVCMHVLLDGRDVDPRSSPRYLSQLEEELGQINQDNSFNYRIGSGGGRMAMTMDRYNADWEMVHRGYNVHVHGDTSLSGHFATNALDEVERQYTENPNRSDQYLEPFVITKNDEPVGRIQNGDGVVLFNFRGDRAIEISQAFDDDDFDYFDRGNRPDVYYCGMLQYDGDLNVPQNYLVNPPVIEQTMIEYMCAEQIKTFAVSETQKFGHVTFFWNGNKSGYIDESLEKYIEIPSDNCEFNEAPEMKAREITHSTIELLDSGEFKFGRINFANGDMVGHTGDIPATVASLECVDHCLGDLIEAVNRNKGILLFTADHGNADEMFVEKNGVKVERTSHSLNPVPFVIHDSQDSGEYEVNPSIDGGLANVASTVFNLLGYKAPDIYEPSLLTIANEPLRKTIYKGRVIDLGIETAILPNQDMMAIEMIRHPGGAVIIAMDNEKRLCLIKQFRHATDGWIWEFPAGILEQAEAPEVAAVRELKEETGCVSDAWTSLGSMYTTPGFCDEQLHMFLAENVEKQEASPETHEFIETHWLTMNEIEDMISTGELKDAKSIVILHLVQRFLNPR